MTDCNKWNEIFGFHFKAIFCTVKWWLDNLGQAACRQWPMYFRLGLNSPPINLKATVLFLSPMCHLRVYCYNVYQLSDQTVQTVKTVDTTVKLHLKDHIFLAEGLRPGSVVVERSPGMREVGGSIPGRVKQKMLKFEVLLLCLALSTY